MTVSANATKVDAGQAIDISLRLSNTRAAALTLPSASDWAFRGIPIAVWEPCVVTLPVEFLVLKGNFTVSQIIAGGNNLTISYTCAEATFINQVAFNPKSDFANVTGVYSQGGQNNTFGPYAMGTNFTLTGYWDQITPQEASPAFYSPSLDGFAYPGIPPSPQHPFAPGVYTLAVADEWGDFGVLHFEVNSPTSGCMAQPFGCDQSSTAVSCPPITTNTTTIVTTSSATTTRTTETIINSCTP
ncbi:MAG: hypothetical protein JRM74_00595 [Nitrososphaerota archaeon]|nr:hypothetical protein [Nitrososphaerota archaeon]MDG6981939.1 hypothetical protein [Nitrososphaerota archaeon]